MDKSAVHEDNKLDHEAAMEAFSGFINDGNLNAQQSHFVVLVIAHVEKNGYMDDPSAFFRAPFDRLVSFS